MTPKNCKEFARLAAPYSDALVKRGRGNQPSIRAKHRAQQIIIKNKNPLTQYACNFYSPRRPAPPQPPPPPFRGPTHHHPQIHHPLAPIRGTPRLRLGTQTNPQNCQKRKKMNAVPFFSFKVGGVNIILQNYEILKITFIK